MKKWLKRLQGTAFDLVSGPTLLAAVGLPVLVGVAVIALIVAAVILIRNALRKNSGGGEETRPRS